MFLSKEDEKFKLKILNHVLKNLDLLILGKSNRTLKVLKYCKEGNMENSFYHYIIGGNEIFIYCINCKIGIIYNGLKCILENDLYLKIESSSDKYISYDIQEEDIFNYRLMNIELSPKIINLLKKIKNESKKYFDISVENLNNESKTN